MEFFVTTVAISPCAHNSYPQRGLNLSLDISGKGVMGLDWKTFINLIHTFRLFGLITRTTPIKFSTQPINIWVRLDCQVEKQATRRGRRRTTKTRGEGRTVERGRRFEKTNDEERGDLRRQGRFEKTNCQRR